MKLGCGHASEMGGLEVDVRAISISEKYVF